MNRDFDDSSPSLDPRNTRGFVELAPAPLLADEDLAEREAREIQHRFEVAMTSKKAPLDLDLVRHGACVGAPNPEVFDTVDDDERALVGKAELARRQREAVSFCRACPVRDACLADAIANDSSGVWGGVFITARGAQHDLIALHDAGQLNKAPAGRGRAKTLAA